MDKQVETMILTSQEESQHTKDVPLTGQLNKPFVFTYV